MPSRIVARLSPVLLAVSIALMLAIVCFQESPSPHFRHMSFSQDMRLLSAEQINNRTLTLAAEISDLSK